MVMRTYSELIALPTYEERFEYLKLDGSVGEETFGWDRWINQKFYKSREWKSIRNAVIVRDNGCDLGIEDYEIRGRILIHHMNPIGIQDIYDQTAFLLNPEYLITTTPDTHRAIHYGDQELLNLGPVTRIPGDTCPWRTV